LPLKELVPVPNKYFAMPRGRVFPKDFFPQQKKAYCFGLKKFPAPQ
jgi:hypothetical protein